MKNILIAYSGGIDSTFLLKVATDLKDCDVTAITVKTPLCFSEEIKRAKKCAKDLQAKHFFLDIDNLLEDQILRSNPPDRCYHCKKKIFSHILKFAKKHSIQHIIDGSNYDDLKDYRPGAKALSEFKIWSPLQEAQFSKEEIRFLSKEFGLSTWNQPAQTCLATRFPYKTPLCSDMLLRVEMAEKFLHKLGFEMLRVRHHQNVARIEIPEAQFFKLIEFRAQIIDEFQKLGYVYVSLDLKGYRMGSMNETL